MLPSAHNEDESAAARRVLRPVEAYHVDDMYHANGITVYNAEQVPAVPWWKMCKVMAGTGLLIVMLIVTLIMTVAVLVEGQNVSVGGTLSPTNPPPSSMPSDAPSISKYEGLFETFCDPLCYHLVAIHKDTAVVTRDYNDIIFFSLTISGYKLITMLDIDYKPSAVAIHGNTAVIGS